MSFKNVYGGRDYCPHCNFGGCDDIKKCQHDLQIKRLINQHVNVENGLRIEIKKKDEELKKIKDEADRTLEDLRKADEDYNSLDLKVKSLENALRLKEWENKQLSNKVEELRSRSKDDLQRMKEEFLSESREWGRQCEEEAATSSTGNWVLYATHSAPQRKYLPTFAELIDRLSINQIKELKIPEHKEEYAKEIQDILYDIDLILNEEDQDGNVKWLDADDIRAVIVLAQMNLHIWHNESEVRKGTGDGDLNLTHGLNGIRNVAKNKLQERVCDGDRKDYKVDCLAAEFKDWEVSWIEEAEEEEYDPMKVEEW